MAAEIYFLINAVALGIASIAAIALLIGLMRAHDKSVGGRIILMTAASITLWIAMPFGELFIHNQMYSFTIGIFGVIMVVGLLLIAMVVPNKKFNWLHWAILLSIIPLSITIFIPGVVYMDMLPQVEGYTIIVPGPYFNLYQFIVAPIYLLASIFVYIYRYIREKDYKVKVLLRVLGIGHTIFICIFFATISALPAYGYSQLVNIGTSFALVFIMSAVTYAFVRYARQR